MIMSDEKGSVSEAGIILPLGVDRPVDGDVVCFSLHDNQWGVLGGLVLRDAPDDEIGTRLSRACTCDFPFLVYLIVDILVFRHEHF